MSRRKVKPPKAKKKPAPEYSIARALAPLSGLDEASLCAFVAESEKSLQAGGLKGWRVTRGNSEGGEPESWVEVRTLEDQVLMGHGLTIREAVASLSHKLISAGLGIAPGEPN